MRRERFGPGLEGPLAWLGELPGPVCACYEAGPTGYPKSTTWTVEHRRWLAKQQFSEPASDLVFADLLAAVDGLTSRKASIALRLSDVATDERWWPTVARLRAFRGIDTLTALSVHLELGRRLEAL